MSILGKVQIGKESALTHGTPVVATKILPTIQKPLLPDSKPTPLKQDVGLNVEVTGVYTQGKLVEDTLVFDQMAFQLMPYLLSGLLKGGVTPAEQTPDQDDYLYDNTPALDNTDNTLDSYTLERGDTVQAVEQEYVMFKRLKMGGQVSQNAGPSPVKGEIDYFGRQNTNTSFTAGLLPLSQNLMNTKLTQIFIDSLWANAGVTEKTNLLRAWDLEIIGGAHPVFNGGNLETFNSHEQGPLGFMLALTIQRGAESEALRAAQGQFKVIRLQINGPVIGSGENQLCQYDLGGYIEDVIAMAEDDQGGKLDTLVLHGMSDGLPATAKLIVPKLITNIATL